VTWLCWQKSRATSSNYVPTQEKTVCWWHNNLTLQIFLLQSWMDNYLSAPDRNDWVVRSALYHISLRYIDDHNEAPKPPFAQQKKVVRVSRRYLYYLLVVIMLFFSLFHYCWWHYSIPGSLLLSSSTHRISPFPKNTVVIYACSSYVDAYPVRYIDLTHVYRVAWICFLSPFLLFPFLHHQTQGDACHNSIFGVFLLLDSSIIASAPLEGRPCKYFIDFFFSTE